MPEAPRRSRLPIVVITVVLALVAGSTAAVAGTAVGHAAAGALDGGTGSSSGGSLTSPSADATAAALETRFRAPIQWQGCGNGGGYYCASIEAPLDWTSSSTSSIHLALIEHRPSGTSQADLLVNPGGPGESGVELVGAGVSNAVDDAVAAKDTVIGFDPRGVGYSTAVKCYDAAGTDSYLYGVLPGTIGSAQWLAADEKTAKAFGAACEKNSGSLLDHVDTTSSARDMDLIRADLGDATLNYLGYSYGTFLGTVYAGLFPKKVGAFVLDGADDPWADTGDTLVAQTKGFEGDLEAWATACLAGKSEATGGAACPFSGTTDQAMSKISALLTSVGAHPLANSDGRELGSSTLATAIIDPLYATSQWPQLTTMFTDVLAGDPAKAFSLADDYNERTSKGVYVDNAAEAYTAIDCLDFGGHSSLSDMRSEAKKLDAAAPVLGPYEGYSDITCNEWPVKPLTLGPKVTAAGAGPIVVVGSTGDPATPYVEAQDLAKQLKSGHLVTRVGEGHTGYNLGNTCIDSTVDAYLLQGTVPTTDPRCT